MRKIVIGCFIIAIGFSVSAVAQNYNKPVVHIEDWSDVTCDAGNPVIRLFPVKHEVNLTCE